LANGVDVPDTTGAFGGAAGGVSPGGYILPPIVFQKAPIDTTGGGKVQGALKGVRKTDSNSDTDSIEDEDNEDTHKLRKIAHAATRGQPLTGEISGDYLWGCGFEEVVFAKECDGTPAPSHILKPLPMAHKAIEALSNYYQVTDMAQSCLWTSAGLPREEIETKVIKA
jgi:hypothetical protein